MSLADLKASHLTAGARYKQAGTELKASLVDLVAHERVLTRDTAHPLPIFGGDWPDVVALRHPVFAPDLAGAWSDDVGPRVEQITASLQAL